MSAVLARLLNLRSGEWPRVFMLFLIAFIAQALGTWGSSIAYAAFQKQLGVESLRWILLACSLLSIPVIAVYGAFVDRLQNDRLLLVIYALNVLSIGAGLLLLFMNLSAIAYPLLYISFIALLAARTPQYITYVNSYYNTQSAKRVLPLVSAGFRAGAVVAGFSMSLLTRWLGATGIIVVWLVGYLVVMGLIAALPRLLGDTGTDGALERRTTPTAEKRASYFDNTREGFRYTVQSPYLRWMAVGTLVLAILLTFVEYATMVVVTPAFATATDLANFLGLLTGIGNIIVLPVLLFLVSRLIGRLGLANASLIFPAGNLAFCCGLVFVPGLLSASLAHLDRVAFRIALQNPVSNLLFNAIPARVRGRARAFIGGSLEPVGQFIGSLCLFLPLVTTAWYVPACVAVLAIAYTISSWFIREQYSHAVLKMLEQEDYSFLLSQEASDFPSGEPAALKQLQAKLLDSNNRELTVFLAQLAMQVGGSNAIPILRPVLLNAKDSRTRAGIVDVVVASDSSGDAVRGFYMDLLADEDGQVRQSAVAGLEELVGPGDKSSVAMWVNLLNDADPAVRQRVLLALARSGRLNEFPQAVQALEALLADLDLHERARGVRVLGALSDQAALKRLLELVMSPDDEVRLEAAVAIESLLRAKDKGLAGADGSIRVIAEQKIIPLLRDPIERVRQAALVILGCLASRESYEAMVNSLVDPSREVRQTAADVLVSVGKAIIPMVHPRVNSNDPEMRKMATVVLSRINPREFGSLIVGSNVTANLLTIYRNFGYLHALQPCRGNTGLKVLQSALREESQGLVEEIFYLLGAIRDPGKLELVHTSLKNESATVRADAAEALEAMTSPQTARLIAPLFDPSLPADQLLNLSRETWDMRHPTTPQAIRELAAHPEDAWLRVTTIYLLGEIGAAINVISTRPAEQPSPAQDQTAPAAPPARRGRRLSADLLGALTGDGSSTMGESRSKTPEPAPTPSGLEFGLALDEIQALLNAALADSSSEVRTMAKGAQRAIAAGDGALSLKKRKNGEEEGPLLSTIERVIFLKEVPFFTGMTVDQLRILANVCEEHQFEQGSRIFNEGETGGALYVVVNGRVAIEHEKRKGSIARLATLESHQYFGEMSLFDASPHSASAVAIQDTLTLRLRREPVLALIRQHPQLSLELIKVLNERLRESNARIVELTRTRPRELHKLYDQFE